MQNESKKATRKAGRPTPTSTNNNDEGKHGDKKQVKTKPRKPEWLYKNKPPSQTQSLNTASGTIPSGIGVAKNQKGIVAASGEHIFQLIAPIIKKGSKRPKPKQRMQANVKRTH